MGILDFIFGYDVEEPMDKNETLSERIEILNDDLVYNINKHAAEVKSLRERISRLEEQSNNNKPANLWASSFNYIKSYCPKCSKINNSQVPKKAKKSMKFVCENCETEYRIMFDKQEIEEVE